MSDPNAPEPSSWQPAPTAPPVPQGATSGEPAPAAPAAPAPQGPPPNAPGTPFGAPYGGAAGPPKKRGRAGKIIGIVAGILVVLLAICGVGLYFGLKDNAVSAKAGDCLNGDGIDTSSTAREVNVKVVACDDASAKYKVHGRVENVAQSKALSDAGGQEICAPYSEATNIIWLGSDPAKGVALCISAK